MIADDSLTDLPVEPPTTEEVNSRLFCADRMETMRQVDIGAASLLIVDPPDTPSELSIANTSFDEMNEPYTTRAARYFLPLVRSAVRVLAPGGGVIVIARPPLLTAWDIAVGDEGGTLRFDTEFVTLWKRPLRRKSGVRVEPVGTTARWYVRNGLHRAAPAKEFSTPSNVAVCEAVPTYLSRAAVQRPVEFFTYFISLLTEPDALIVDPYCGTGSSLVAAEIMGRRWIAGDISQTMVDISRDRVLHAEHEAAYAGRFHLWTPTRSIEQYS